MPAPRSLTRNVLINTIWLTTRLSRTPRMPYISARPSSNASNGKSTFTYRLAAASAGKRTPPRPAKANQDLFLYTSTHPNPSPPYLRSTKAASGEDAFFATTVGGSANQVAFGVADGVGGWQDQGIDPSEFSHGLCGYMAGSAYLWNEAEEKRALRPLGLLQTAYDAVMGNPRIVAGGCTASLAVVGREGEMECANLGDSSYIHLSPQKIAHRSPIQTHAFNTPYQLAKIPAKLQTQYSIFGSSSSHFSEIPSQAEVTKHKLKHGDIVVFATDGVWDNLSSQDALGIVSRIMTEKGYWLPSKSNQDSHGGSPETLLNASLISALPTTVSEKDADSYLPGLLAAAILREAKVAGLDRRREGPFAKEVKMHYPEEGYEGGKPDDIAVVVCVAVEETVGQGGEKAIRAKL